MAPLYGTTAVTRVVSCDVSFNGNVNAPRNCCACGFADLAQPARLPACLLWFFAAVVLLITENPSTSAVLAVLAPFDVCCLVPSSLCALLSLCFSFVSQKFIQVGKVPKTRESIYVCSSRPALTAATAEATSQDDISGAAFEVGTEKIVPVCCAFRLVPYVVLYQ